MLIQPFLPEIVVAGEISFLFFGGHFSHAVLKQARDGDFRVQSDFGGRVTPIEPAAAVLSQARRIAAAIPRPGLFARIDAVDRDGSLVLMEIELIEPELFLARDRQAAARLARALRSRLAAGSIHIRQARREELPSLLEIERRAAGRFALVDGLGEEPLDLTPLDELREACSGRRVWVAVTGGGEVVGFAYAAVIDGSCHLEEVDVLPEYGRRGIGASLVREVRAHAEREGLRGVTLTTYRSVPWNAPFYRRLGFEIVDRGAWTPGLVAAVEDEARRGLDTEQRVVMAWRR